MTGGLHHEGTVGVGGVRAVLLFVSDKEFDAVGAE
jgi:hypothetical protein